MLTGHSTALAEWWEPAVEPEPFLNQWMVDSWTAGTMSFMPLWDFVQIAT